MNRLRLLSENRCPQKKIWYSMARNRSFFLFSLFCFGVLWPLPSQDSSHLMEAKRYESKEQFLQAAELWGRLLLQNPNSSAAYWGLARSHMRMGNYSEALNFADQALLLDNQNHEIGVLKSRTLRNLGRYTEAQSLLEQLQERHESPAIDLALAQLALVLGDTALSIRYLDSIRESFGGDLAFLLTSLIAYEELGDWDSAERYLREAFNTHYNNAVLHKVAAAYYLRRGDYGAVQRELGIAGSLGMENEALLLQGLEAAYLERDYGLAVELGDALVQRHPRGGGGWYLLGLACAQSGQLERALTALNTARRIESQNPQNTQNAAQNEWAKIVMAELLRTRHAYPSEWHSREARRYIDAANARRENLLYEEALQEYRFALQLDPLNRENWMAFANVFRDRGNYAKYLDKLYAWQEFGPGTTIGQSVEPELERLIAMYEASQRQSVAENWSLEQYQYENRYYPLQVFVLSDTGSIRAPAELLGSYFANILQWYEQPFVVGDVEVVEDPLEAQQIANGDYYAVLDFSAARQRVNLGLYLSSSGRRLQTLEREIEGKVYDAFFQLARGLHEVFPQKGQIIAAKMNRAVLSLGSLDGINKGDEWVVLSKEVALGAILGTGEYEREQLLGTLVIEEVDEKISEGRVQSLGNLGNRLQVGDIALALPPEEADVAVDEVAPPETEGFIQRVRGWFGRESPEEAAATDDEREGLIERIQGWFAPQNQEEMATEQKGFIQRVRGWFQRSEQTDEAAQPVAERRTEPNMDIQIRLQELP